jgi:hypothetical protein
MEFVDGNGENVQSVFEVLNLEYCYDPERTNEALGMIANYFEIHIGTLDKKA